jgi:arsenate reductase (glutaredoxin)
MRILATSHSKSQLPRNVRKLNESTSQPIEMTKPITIYGIKNCDTMKKARAWLDSHDIAYEFHDYKTAGAPKEKLKAWTGEVGWETLLNRAGTTFRKLPEAEKEGLNERKALALMQEQPSMIKRPVLEAGGKLLVGFKPEVYAKELGGRAR